MKHVSLHLPLIGASREHITESLKLRFERLMNWSAIFVGPLFVFMAGTCRNSKGDGPSNARPRRNVKQVDYTGARRRRKKRSRARGITYAQIGTKVMRDVAYLKRMFNTEDKYIDTNNSISPTNAAWYQTCLNACNLGTSSVTRTGQSLRAVDLQFNVRASIGTGSHTFVRMCLVRDKESHGEALATAKVFQDDTNLLSLRNPAYNTRYDMLYDDIFVLCSAGQSAQVFSRVLNINWHVEYNNLSDEGDYTDITKNALWWLLFTNEDNTHAPLIVFTMRFSFVDN